MSEADVRAAVEKMDAENTGLEWICKPAKNQGNEGSCVGNMAAKGIELLQSIEAGYDRTNIISAMSIYRNIGSSPQSGAMVSDALDFIAKYGALPQSTPENIAEFGAEVCAPATGWLSVGRYASWSQTRKEVAGYFKLQEFYVVQSYWGLMSSLCRGWPVGVGRAGHSILYVRPAIRNGKLGVVYINSWGDWGFGAGQLASGFGYDSGSLVQQSASWAICFRSLVRR
jgi:hypothetical protein